MNTRHGAVLCSKVSVELTWTPTKFFNRIQIVCSNIVGTVVRPRHIQPDYFSAKAIDTPMDGKTVWFKFTVAYVLFWPELLPDQFLALTAALQGEER